MTHIDVTRSPRLRAALLLALVFMTGGWSTPQRACADTSNASGLWLMSFTRLKLSDSVKGFVDLQPRIAFDDPGPGRDGELRQLIARGAVGIRLAPSVDLYQGYAYITGYEPRADEHRSFQEIFSRYGVDEYQLTHRLRFEQRFLEDVSGTSLRGRYMFRAQRPLVTWNDLSPAISNELFWTLNEAGDGPESGFDQNRLFLGVNYRIDERLSADVGYQHQYVERRHGADNISNHVLFLGLISQFDLDVLGE